MKRYEYYSASAILTNQYMTWYPKNAGHVEASLDTEIALIMHSNRFTY